MKESPVFTKTFDMLARLLPATLKFPREHRFILAQRTQNAAFNFYEAITAASLSQHENINECYVNTQKGKFHAIRSQPLCKAG